MKKHISTLILFIGITISAVAQLKKGVVSYDLTFTSDKEEMAMIAGMMEGSKFKLSFMPGKSRTDITMGMMGNMTTISDSKAKKTLALTDMMGMKYAVESDLNSMETKESNESVELTTETKTIAGYTCSKANITTPEGGSLIVWYTKDIVAYTEGQTYINNKIPGFPMEMKLEQDGLIMEFVATSVEKTVSKKIFSRSIPEGYELKTQEELMNMGGGE